MSSIRKILFAMILGFGFTAVSSLQAPVAMAASDLVGQINQGKDAANEGGLGVIGIALILCIAGTVALTLFPPSRRLGIALGIGLLIVVVGVVVSKKSSIGETISSITSADNVTDILHD